METPTLYFRLNDDVETAAFAKVFGEYLLGPVAAAKPVAVAALGGMDTGKSFACLHALTPLIGDRRAAAIRRPGQRPRVVRYHGGVYRRADFGYLEHRLTREGSGWTRHLLSPGGLLTRAQQGYPGVDWIERATLPHIVRADYVLTFAGAPLNGNREGYGAHMVGVLQNTLAIAPRESRPLPVPARRFYAFWQPDPKLEQPVGWNAEKAAYVKDVIIPQITNTADLAGDLRRSGPSFPELVATGRIIGLTIQPLLQPDASRLSAFRHAVRRFEVSLNPG